MAAIIVKSNLNNLKRLEKNITKVNLSDKLAKEFAVTLQKVIQQRSPSGSGNLAGNIRARKLGRYGAGVYAPYYFWMANNGRRAGRNPPDEQSRARFEKWAVDHGMGIGQLSRAIGKRGTKPRFYYQATYAIERYRRPRAYKKILKAT